MTTPLQATEPSVRPPFAAAVAGPTAHEAQNHRLPRRYRTIWVSDVHLGARAAKAGALLAFLRASRCEHLYLVGDILDFWKLKRRVHWPQDHSAVVSHLLALARSGTRVTYVPGNHDVEFRGHGIVELGDVEVRDEVVHHTADGRRLLVTHGDRFDDYGEESAWLVALGDWLYAWTVRASEALNVVRKWCGRPYWSLSLHLKQKVKGAVGFVSRFEERVTAAARERHVDGVVCGHIHKAELRDIDGVTYANDGDWVESCTALVEHACGRLELLQWNGVEAVPISGTREYAAVDPAVLAGV
ncbi:MAG: UDP-2,3-diacylglucosamine diphosphatase [Planctomycetota bacterium]